MESVLSETEGLGVRNILHLLSLPDTTSNVKALEFIFKLAATGKDINIYLSSSTWRNLIAKR
jgi:hypothetical protein